MKATLGYNPATTTQWFYFFCAIHFTVWILLPLLVCGNAPFDSLEGVAWGSQWQLGYDKHPFLAPWLTAGMVRLVGQVDAAIYLLSQLSIVICFWAMWRIALKFLSPLPALISIILLEGIYYYNVASPQFNPNILMLSTWALTCLAFYKAIAEQKTIQWILLGICAGLAMLTKYEAPLLLGSMFIFMCVNPAARKNFLSYKPYLALAICLLCFLPNAVWLWQHDFIPFTYTSERLDNQTVTHISGWLNHFYQPLRFGFEQLGAIAGLFLLALPLFFCKRNSTTLPHFDKQFLYIIGLGPFALALLFSAITAAWLNSLWAFPFFSFVGILLMVELQSVITKQRWQQFLIWTISLCSAVIIYRGIYLAYSPYLTGHMTAALYPGKNITRVLSEQWQTNYHVPLQYVAGSPTEVRNIVGYSKDRPQAYFDWDAKRSAWIDENKMRQAGALFVWKVKGSQGESLKPDIFKRFPEVKEQGVIIFPLLSQSKRAKPIKIGYAFLPPQE